MPWATAWVGIINQIYEILYSVNRKYLVLVIVAATALLSPLALSNFGISIEALLLFYGVCLVGLVSAKGWWRIAPLVLLVAVTGFMAFLLYVLASGRFMDGWQF